MSQQVSSDLANPSWLKPVRTSPAAGDDVEVAPAGRGIVVRDTTDRSGPVLRVSAETW